MDGRWHRPNGQYASNEEIGISTQTIESTDIDNIHGNSLDYPGKNYGYVLRDRNTGEILKYGETIRPDTRYSQVELDRYNADMEITKQEIHQWQHDMNILYRDEHGTWPKLLSPDGDGW